MANSCADAPRQGRKKPRCARTLRFWCIASILACAVTLIARLQSTATFTQHRSIVPGTEDLWPLGGGTDDASSYETAPAKTLSGGPCTASALSAYFTAASGLRTNTATSPADGPVDLTHECARSFKLPRSVISEEDAARVRCTSSFSNAISNEPSAQRDVGASRPTSVSSSPSSSSSPSPSTASDHSNSSTDTAPQFIPASICVFYLNYRNLDNLVTSVKTHGMRARNPTIVSHTVLTMDEDDSEVAATRQALGFTADVHRLVFPPGTRGGDPLPVALRLISLLSACPLTVVSDSDAFMLREGWDQRLVTAFLDPQLALFASNPRHSSHGTAFRDVAEWNWMAYRTKAFAGLVIGAGPVQHLDVGHYYTNCVNATGHAKHLHLQGTLWPYQGKAATVVSDTDGAHWILHLFYASRHNNEPDSIKSEARQYSLSPSELAELRVNLTRSRLLDARSTFGLT